VVVAVGILKEKAEVYQAYLLHKSFRHAQEVILREAGPILAGLENGRKLWTIQ
jgi:hypothetical protein